ncbi:hypothetical protein pEaSNUABM37_00178 [Erwinia phage pEa_SNUABM_37]|nr:hypothetical protein pEaSNUABM37_00178 [Erwinia phage pEa_SNUABM_37]QXO10648.1 hypothetical protein pEaSNUABM48_00178 [Erwinia phage pEa_SNUABM_48]
MPISKIVPIPTLLCLFTTKDTIMIIDAPHSVARAFLGMKELETFIPRYTEVVLKTVTEMHNSAERLKTDDKETRDGTLGTLLVSINNFILGEDPKQIKAWPLVTLTPLHVGLAYRSQMIYLLSRDEIDVRNILNFINVVYFPALNLNELNECILRTGKYCDPNSARTQRLVLLLAHQVAQLSARQELVLPSADNNGDTVDDEPAAGSHDDSEGEA